MTCPFCEITISEAAFARSTNFLAIYNIAPILPGHSLIIPIKHIESLLALPADELNEFTLFSRSVTIILLKVFNAEAFNWSIQDKEEAGQSIAHLHLHIVPRYKNDLPDPGDWYPKIRENTNEILDNPARQRIPSNEMRIIVDELRKESKNRGFWY